ncbi:HEAT repeat domain-containing protein [Streptomyces viridochromogenes]|uniref:HEAT repeat domain-containing protein n=1 Tax=Streptomyces viridochromogenes TaxID=1938 RepID=UPI001F459F57|nr:HEAT repeat domain-containing protein [Streptomyces viridochromogenes]
MGVLGVPDVLLATVTAALTDPARQVRAGATTALGGAASDHGVPSLAGLPGDADADVRKAAVLGLLRHVRTTAPVRHWRRRSTTRTPTSVRARATTPRPEGGGACSLNFRNRL